MVRPFFIAALSIAEEQQGKMGKVLDFLPLFFIIIYTLSLVLLNKKFIIPKLHRRRSGKQMKEYQHGYRLKNQGTENT